MSRKLFSLDLFVDFGTFVAGQMISQNMLSRLDVLSTAEASASEDDSFLGYSAAVGDLDNDGRTDVAVGMPRGANLTGKVRIRRKSGGIFLYFGSQIRTDRWCCSRPT